MTGRALLIGTLFIGLGLAGVTWRVDAQSDIEQDDVSTGEISEESSSSDLGSEDVSSEDHWSDDSFSTDTGDKGIARPPARPPTPVRPNH
jgi:hypothetical protein